MKIAGSEITYRCGSIKRITLALVLLIAPALLLPASITNAGEPREATFARAWERTDLPVIAGEVARTWWWGPASISEIIEEPGTGAAGESRTVIYYDKGRMEIPDPAAEPSLQDFVQSGRIITELITGEIVVGDGETRRFEASRAIVAGDAGDSEAVTYKAIGGLLGAPPHDAGETLTAAVSADGSLTDGPEFAAHAVTAEHHVAETNHVVASVFWEFLNSSGTVWDGGEFVDEPLFADPFAGTGMPIIEAYWQSVEVAGEVRDVLVQCFQRRCLTYTPANPEGWQVEVTNSGHHYYDWRYNQIDFDEPVEDPDASDDLPAGRYVTSDGQEHAMRLEVAASDPTRACGLMHRDSLGADTGMLFVWDFDHQGSFWNCNTFVPLTLAWIDADGEITGFTEMQPQIRGEPQNVISYPPPGPYRYVVEANQGWFAERGIAVGDQAILDEALDHGDTDSDTLCQQLGLACN